jgi:hypothetical protein
LRNGTYDELKTPGENLDHAIKNNLLANDWDTLTLTDITLKLPEGTEIPSNIQMQNCTVEYVPTNETTPSDEGESVTATTDNMKLEAPSAKPLFSVSAEQVSELFGK